MHWGCRVKLLFDQNLSPRLVDLPVDIFPRSSHVQSVGLERAADEVVWRFALDHDFKIVTKDSGFQERSQMAVSGPRVVWIRRGNCTTSAIAAMLRKNLGRIVALGQDTDPGFSPASLACASPPSPACASASTGRSRGRCRWSRTPEPMRGRPRRRDIALQNYA